MRTPSRHLALTLALLGLAACSGTGKYAKQAGRYVEGAGRAATDTLLPVEEENKLGRQMKPEIEKEVKLLNNDKVVDYVKALGAKAVQAASDKPQGIRFTFKVIDDKKTVNAFAIPGGTIYVYTGLIKKVDDEAELLAVLCHEVAHVTRRHVAQSLIAQQGLETVLQMALGKQPGLLSQLAAGIAANGFLLKYSRDHEREADAYGIGYEAKAGRDPNGFVSFFKKLDDGSPDFLAIISTHPSSKERVELARAKIKELRSPPSERGAEALREIKALL